MTVSRDPRGIADAQATAPSTPTIKDLRTCNPHCVIETLKCLVHFPVAMGSGDEPRLECRRSEIHTAFQCCLKRLFEEVDVAALRILEIPHRPGVEKESPHRS